jgi:hypothetical protein
VEAIAAHCWFADYDPLTGCWTRWEVWQTPGTGPNDWGHVRRNLMGPRDGVGAGPSWVLAEWTGQDARRIQAVLAAPASYPCRNEYSYWPGPNSNTYVAWVLREAGLEAELPPAAIGSHYR